MCYCYNCGYCCNYLNCCFTAELIKKKNKERDSLLVNDTSFNNANKATNDNLIKGVSNESSCNGEES